MSGIERTPGRRPRGVRRECTESPHVDDPIHTRDRLEAKRRNGIQDRQDETDRVRDPEPQREEKGQRLATEEQHQAEMQQVAWQRGRRVQIADVALVLVEHAIDRERAAVEKHNPYDESEECGWQLL